jgi:thiol-disulfide isomerase/thioredoxin
MIRALLPLTGKARRTRFALVAGAGVLGAAFVTAAVYGMLSFRRNAPDPRCEPALEVARRIAPLAHGEIAAFAVAEQPLVVPNLVFRDASGAERRLSDWRGRTVLLNLWATWCVPCRKEMPELNAVQGRLGGSSFEVVAINIDTRDPEKPRAWLNAAGIDKLAYYADNSAKIFQTLKTVGRAAGLPTSLIIDGAGCEIGTIAGPAEWASAEALALVNATLTRDEQAPSSAHSHASGDITN